MIERAEAVQRHLTRRGGGLIAAMLISVSAGCGARGTDLPKPVALQLPAALAEVGWSLEVDPVYQHEDMPLAYQLFEDMDMTKRLPVRYDLQKIHLNSSQVRTDEAPSGPFTHSGGLVASIYWPEDVARFLQLYEAASLKARQSIEEANRRLREADPVGARQVQFDLPQRPEVLVRRRNAVVLVYESPKWLEEQRPAKKWLRQALEQAGR